MVGIVVRILIDQLTAVEFLAVVGAVDANGGGDSAAIYDDGCGVAAARCGGDLHGASAYGYVFAFKTLTRLDRFEMSHLFGDFGRDFLHLLVNEIPQCRCDDRKEEHDAEEDRPHTPIALAGLLAEHVSAIVFVAVFEHQFVPLA